MCINLRVRCGVELFYGKSVGNGYGGDGLRWRSWSCRVSTKDASSACQPGCNKSGSGLQPRLGIFSVISHTSPPCTATYIHQSQSHHLLSTVFLSHHAYGDWRRRPAWRQQGHGLGNICLVSYSFLRAQISTFFMNHNFRHPWYRLPNPRIIDWSPCLCDTRKANIEQEVGMSATEVYVLTYMEFSRSETWCDLYGRPTRKGKLLNNGKKKGKDTYSVPILSALDANHANDLASSPDEKKKKKVLLYHNNPVPNPRLPSNTNIS